MQARDFAQLSLQELAEKCNCAWSCETRHHRRRDVTDGMSTLYWFYGVRTKSGLLTARALERHFEPDSMRDSAFNVRLLKNKWSGHGYGGGLHVPSDALLTHVDEELPGSSRDIKHVVWSLLGPDSDRINDAECLSLLRSDFQDLLFGWRKREAKAQPNWTPLNQRMVHMLERRASLDALAALILLIRRALAMEQLELAHAWCRSLYRVLVILGPLLLRRGIARSLFELIELRVMPSRDVGCEMYWMPLEWYQKSIGVVMDALYHIHGVPYHSLTVHQKIVHTHDFLEGKYGWDYKFALGPLRMYRIAQGEDGSSTLTVMEHDWILANWARNMLSTGGHPLFPPAEVFTKGDVWARDPKCK